MKHYADDPGIPFRALWLYIIQYELTPGTSELDLKCVTRVDEQDVLVAIMLEDITEEQVFKVIQRGLNTSSAHA